MKLYSYVVVSDNGYAPNPTDGVCTLAYCKPEVRWFADPGDYVVGLAKYRRYGLAHNLCHEGDWYAVSRNSSSTSGTAGTSIRIGTHERKKPRQIGCYQSSFIGVATARHFRRLDEPHCGAGA